MTPRTAAGRGFIERYAHASPGDAYRREVVAIEDEAARDALVALRATAENIPVGDYLNRPAVLALIDAALRPPEPDTYFDRTVCACGQMHTRYVDTGWPADGCKLAGRKPLHPPLNPNGTYNMAATWTPADPRFNRDEPQ